MKYRQLIIAFLFLFWGTECQLTGQSPQFEQETFSYYWAVGQLVNFHTPTVAFGIEFKTEHRFSLAFDLGVGSLIPSANDKESSFFHREVSNWASIKSNVFLKYHYRYQYNKKRLRRWRRRIEKGKRVKPIAPPNFKPYIGLHLGFEPTSYRTQSGVYSKTTTASGRTLVYYKKAAVLSTAMKLGLIVSAWQLRFGKHNRYIEVGSIFGLTIIETRYFDVENRVPSANPGPPLFSYYRPLNFYEGTVPAPYVQVMLNIGLFK